MAGLDRRTLKPLDGFAHVVQSIDVILATRIGSRVMRRHFGSSAVALLGRMLSADTIVQFFAVYALAIEIWEPRFRIVRVIPLATSVDDVRLGRFAFATEGEYRPRGHLGDPTPEGLRRINYTQSSSGLAGAAA